MPRTIKKKYNKCFSSPPASFFGAASLFFLFVTSNIEDTVFSRVFVNYKLTCESSTEVPYYVAFADPLFLCGSEVDLKGFEAN